MAQGMGQRAANPPGSSGGRKFESRYVIKGVILQRPGVPNNLSPDRDSNSGQEILFSLFFLASINWLTNWVIKKIINFFLSFSFFLCLFVCFFPSFFLSFFLSFFTYLFIWLYFCQRLCFVCVLFFPNCRVFLIYCWVLIYDFFPMCFNCFRCCCCFWFILFPYCCRFMDFLHL